MGVANYCENACLDLNILVTVQFILGGFCNVQNS